MDVEVLYRQYGPMVIRRCRKLLKDDDEALDVAQDVFVQVLRRQNSLTNDHPSSLLYRIATNLCLNRIRDRRRAQDAVEDDILTRIAFSDIDERTLDARNTLNRIFGRHPESTRTIATLLYVDGMTLEEVADTVGVSVSGVRKRMRGLKAEVVDLEEP